MSSLFASVSAIATTAASSAGGASARDLGIAGGIAGFAIIVLLMGGLGHRSEMVTTLTWFERFSERVSGQPAWASLPCGLAIISLLTAVFGLYWDVSLHVDRGRDPGLFSNPSHMFILAGLYGIFAAGWFSICLSREDRADRPGPTAIRITRDWYAPLGGLMMCGAGLFSLLGFPLDDFWHRLFGQDVTLWGPTHLMLIGGAAMTLVGIAIIQVEVRRAVRASGQPDREYGWVRHLRHVWLPGGLLIGLSTFQGEFDWGVPQFQLVYHPLLIMLAAGVDARRRARLARPGPRARRGRVLHRDARRPRAARRTTRSARACPHFPLYIAEALIVEGVALVVAVKRPLLFGAVCGALIGTVGLAAEWGWTHVWMPIPWPREILAETIVLRPRDGGRRVAHRRLDRARGWRPSASRTASPCAGRRVASAVVVGALLAFPLFTQSTTGLSARVALRDVDTGAQAHGDRDGHAEPAQRRRRCEVADGDGMAGRRPRRRPPAPGLRRRVRDHEAGPAVRRLEDDDPAAQGQRDPRAADLRARRSRDPRPRRRGAAGRLTGRSSPTTSCCSARPGRRPPGSPGPRTSPSSPARWRCSACWPGASTASA